MKQFFCLLALLCLCFNALSQPNTTPKPLAIGDRFPEINFSGLANLPVSKIQYNSYNSKLLILDFWATWCSSCIAQFPKISSLQKDFSGKLQFLLVPHHNSVADSIKIVKFFAARSAAYRLPSLTRDSLLVQLFPHQSIPHYVWINNGKVIAITDASALTPENISNAINNATMKTHEKKDRQYDADSSLQDYARTADSSPINSSLTLTGHIDGFSTMTGYAEKNGLIKRYAINVPLLSLYRLAFPELSTLAANRVIWNTTNVRDAVPDYAAWDAWKIKHTYCFEFIISSSLSAQMPGMIKNVLDNYFRLATGFANRDMPCLVLKAGKKFKPISKAKKQLINTLEEKGVVRELYGGSQQLCDFLNLQLTIPVINGIPGELLDLSLPDELFTVESLRSWLAPYGLELTSSSQNMRVFYVSDAP